MKIEASGRMTSGNIAVMMKPMHVPIWEAMRPYGTHFEEIADAVVVYGGCVVRGRGSGAETDSPMAWVVTLKDGKIVSHRGFRDPESALAAAEAAAVPD